MPRAIWRGSISFGLVNVPVGLYGATSDKSVHFHQIDEKSGSRVQHKRVSAKNGREVPNERIVSGYETSKGHYVVLSDEELEAAAPERSHTIDVEEFVGLAEIDPLHFNKSYWVAPASDQGARKAYALLLSTLEESERVAIGRFVLRTKEHLVALRAHEGALCLHTMRYADEIVKPSSLEGLPVKSKVDTKARKAAVQLVDSLTADWDASRHRDTYRKQLLAVIDKKRKGKEIKIAEAPDERADVIDLMEALERSVADAKKARSAKKRSTASRRKSA